MSLALLVALAAGAPSTWVFARRRRWLLGAAVLPFASLLALTLPWIVSALSGSPVAGWWWQALVAGLALAAGLELLCRLQGAHLVQQLPVERIPGVFALSALAAVFAACAWTGARLAQADPGYLWDGWAIWLLRAKVLADSTAGFPIGLATEPQIGGSHWDYPLLLPAALGWFRRAAGLELRELVLPLGLLAGTLPLAGWAGLWRRASPALAAAAVLSPFAVPALLYHHYGAYADGLMVVLATIGLAWALAGVARDDRLLLLAAGLPLAAMVAVKNEGTLWLGAHGVVIALAALRSSRRPGQAVVSTLCAMAPAALLLSAWQLACRRIGVANDVISGFAPGHAAERLPRVASTIGGEMIEWERLTLLVPALLLAAGLSGGDWRVRVRALAWVLLAPAVYVAAIAIVYLGTPADLEWHLRTSSTRVLFGVVPAVYASLLLVGAPGRISSGGS